MLRLDDQTKFLQEETRLKSLANVTTAAGYDPSMIEDFADELYDVVKKTAASMQTVNAEATLLETFNDEGLQNSVITYLRVCCPTIRYQNRTDH